MARTFQNIRVFRSMTVEENVMVAGHHLHQSNLADALCARAYARDEGALSARAQELLEVFGLKAARNDLAGSLPYGSQRRLEIARASCVVAPGDPARRASRRA